MMKCGAGDTILGEPLAMAPTLTELQQSRSQVAGALLAQTNPTGSPTAEALDVVSKTTVSSTAGVIIATLS